jgi:hypothetical protein
MKFNIPMLSVNLQKYYYSVVRNLGGDKAEVSYCLEALVTSL